MTNVDPDVVAKKLLNREMQVEDILVDDEEDVKESEVSDSIEPILDMCEELQPMGVEENAIYLGFLRPRDTFKFFQEIPFPGLCLDTTYRVVPADRGFLQWTNDTGGTLKVPLDQAFRYRIVPQFDYSVKNYKFYPGDRVRSRDTLSTGEVYRAEAQGYVIKFDGRNDEQWVPTSTIRLQDKELTTRNYIEDTDDGYRVQFADVDQIFDHVIDALSFLMEANRPAFNRLSNYIAGHDPEEFEWLTDEVVDHLVIIDPKVWTQDMAYRFLSPG